MLIGSIVFLIGAIPANFIVFIVAVVIAESSVFMGTGPIGMALMSSCAENLRG
jgi:hypothetical protein